MFRLIKKLLNERRIKKQDKIYSEIVDQANFGWHESLFFNGDIVKDRAEYMRLHK